MPPQEPVDDQLPDRDSRPQTCWSNRTPFQMALILILIVAVPFLIAMIITYTVYLTRTGGEECAKLCKILTTSKLSSHNFREKPQLKPMHPYFYRQNSNNEKSGGFRKRFAPDFEVSNLSRIQSIGALLEKLYADDTEEERFICSVVIMSPKWALTITECFPNTTWNQLSIRVNSKYWSEGDSTKKIESLRRHESLVALRIKSDPLEPNYRPVNIGSLTRAGKILFWNATLYQPLKSRKKIDSLRSLTVYLPNSEFIGEIGAPLFDEHENLLGFQRDWAPGALVYIKIDTYRHWLEEIFSVW